MKMLDFPTKTHDEGKQGTAYQPFENDKNEYQKSFTLRVMVAP